MPCATAMTSGKPASSQYTVDPQVGQNHAVTALPLSAMRVHAVAGPAIVTWSRLNRELAAKTLPVRRWQAMQWHIDTRAASPAQRILSAPH